MVVWWERKQRGKCVIKTSKIINSFCMFKFVVNSVWCGDSRNEIASANMAYRKPIHIFDRERRNNNQPNNKSNNNGKLNVTTNLSYLRNIFFRPEHLASALDIFDTDFGVFVARLLLLLLLLLLLFSYSTGTHTMIYSHPCIIQYLK